MEWDPGPPPTLARIFEQAPVSTYKSMPHRFRLEWGPVYYRGRLGGEAKILVIGQDPAADENIARRILVGDAGQRVQGFLAKLGITRSYVMVNTFLYSIVGQFDKEMKVFADLPDVSGWRNNLLDSLATPNIKAVLAFGNAARHAVDSWPAASFLKNQGRVFYLLHPTARPDSKVLANWSGQLQDISAKVSSDVDGALNLSPYAASEFTASDLARIPLFDFSFGAPAWFGTGDMATRKTVSGISAILLKALGQEG